MELRDACGNTYKDNDIFEYINNSIIDSDDGVGL